MINQLPAFERSPRSTHARRPSRPWRTVVQDKPLIGFRSVAGTKFIIHVRNGGVDLMPLFNRLNRLLGTQRDQHTEDNDRYLFERMRAIRAAALETEMYF